MLYRVSFLQFSLTTYYAVPWNCLETQTWIFLVPWSPFLENKFGKIKHCPTVPESHNWYNFFCFHDCNDTQWFLNINIFLIFEVFLNLLILEVASFMLQWHIKVLQKQEREVQCFLNGAKLPRENIFYVERIVLHG